MDYREAERYLKNAGTGRGMQLGLSRMRRLAGLLGNPEDRVPMIHIAGTNGKGSVAAWLEAILTAAGYRTGAYTSPAVFSALEPFRIDGAPITEEQFAALVSKAADACGKAPDAALEPTRFELETACAFLLFAEENCDIAVVETGLGGDEDATNIMSRTVLSVITSISMDHGAYLGNTTARIASHKAGIMRPGIPCVSAPQEASVRQVLGSMQDPACLLFADPERCTVLSSGPAGTVFTDRHFGKLTTTQHASWQRENLAVALTAAESLRSSGFDISDEAVRTGVAAMRWRGRFEVIGNPPRAILDGAHNPQGASGLLSSLKCFPDGRNLAVVTGVLADKDYRGMIGRLFAGPEGIAGRTSVICTLTPDSPRALTAEALAAVYRELVPDIASRACGSVGEALEYACRSHPEDLILVFGSLSFLREADAWLEAHPHGAPRLQGGTGQM